MRLLRTLALVASMFVFAASNAQADNFARKIDGFDFFVDYSGSMMQQLPKNDIFEGKKLEAAKAVLTKVNSMIPDLGYEGSLHTFSPSSTVVPYAAWDQASMNAGIESLKSSFQVFNRRTGMGNGILEFAPGYAKMANPSALIIVSDGENNVGIDPISEARMLLEVNPEICLHVISFADTAEGQALLDELAGMKDCSVQVKGLDLLASDVDAEQFVKDVFYHAEDAIVLRGVNFAFDSYRLDSAAKAMLDEVAILLESENKKVILEGWTDSIGSESYNKTLSMKRAEAVEAYLEQQGVPADMLTAIGMGESYKYDNSTEQGRYLNRRTEVLFK